MVWVLLVFLIFILLIVFAGLQSYGQLPPDFADLANGLGITPVRTWRHPGVGGGALPVRYGSCYAGTYRDMEVAVFTVVDNDRGILGTGLTFRFIRPLSLSLFCSFHIDSFAATTIQDEYRDIYLKRVDTDIEDLKAWSGEKDKAMMLLRGGDVNTHLEHLTGLVQGGDREGLPGLRRAGFMVSDQGVSLFVTKSAMLNRELVDEAFLLTQALSGSGLGMPGGAARAESHGLKVLAMIFLILFMGFIIGVMIVGIFKLKITPILSILALN